MAVLSYLDFFSTGVQVSHLENLLISAFFFFFVFFFGFQSLLIMIKLYRGSHYLPLQICAKSYLQMQLTLLWKPFPS